MKKLCLISLVILLINCNPPPNPSPNNQTTSVYNIFGGNSPTSPDSTTCLPVDRVRIVEAPTNLGINKSARIDVTPRDAFGNTRSDQCNEKDGNRWDSNEDTCFVGDVNSFVTTVTGVKVGTCELTACVLGKCDSVKFSVN